MVDDGSRDNSAQLISHFAKRYPHVVKDFTDPQSGNLDAPGRYNQLIPECRNRWIAILNSDDTFTPGRFEMLALSLAKSDADFIFGNVLVTNAHGDVVGRKRAFFDPEYPFGTEPQLPQVLAATHPGLLLASQNFIATTSNMVFKRDLFQELNGFRPFRYCHDWDFALRASLLGKPRYVGQYLVNYRVHTSNTISENLRAVKTEVCKMFESLKEVFRSHPSAKELDRWLKTNLYLKAEAEDDTVRPAC